MESEEIPTTCTVIGVGKKGDIVAKNLQGKIVFLTTGDSVCREYAEKHIKFPAVCSVTERHEKYDRGILELYQCKGRIRGNPETIRVLMKLLDELRGRSEMYGDPCIREIYQGKKPVALGIYYKSEFTDKPHDYYLDAADFVSKIEEIREILEYNEKVDALNREINDVLTQLDTNKDTALLPEDWDWQKAQWNESGIAKIQKREKVIDSIVSRVTQMDRDVWVKTWVYRGSLIKECYSDRDLLTTHRIHVTKPPRVFSPKLVRIDELLKEKGIRVGEDYIIRPFPMPIYSRCWDDDYGTPITSAIYGGCWRDEDFLLFEKTTAYNRPAYRVYPVVTAKTKEEAMRRAEEIADGDGTVEDIGVSRITNNLWKVAWSVFD